MTGPDERSFLLLLHGDERAGESPVQMSEETRARWGEFAAEVRAAGMLIRWLALHPSSTAVTVRTRSDRTMVTDGPFAELREQVGGFYWIRCASREEAIAVAARMPCAETGTVHVREVHTHT